MQFEWDEDQRRSNFAKRGVDFAVASSVFSGVTATLQDTRKDYGEARFTTLGQLEERVVVIVHTQREESIRIISMRKAN